MKTIKAGTLLKKIEDQDPDFISIQLRVILQEQRAKLIDGLISSGLDRYVDYKFNRKLTSQEASQLKAGLIAIRNGSINMLRYKSFLDSVIKYDFVQLNNALFFEEIDAKLKERMAQKELFQFRVQESEMVYG